MSRSAATTQVASRDDDLVAAARAGSRPAFGELVERYQSLVSAVAFAMTGSPSLSEEIAQDAFVAAWSQLGDLRRADRFRSWVCGIARNLARRSQRDEPEDLRARHDTANAEELLPSADPSPLEQAIGREEERFLWRALGAIPEIYRVPLVLFYREQQSVEEVAAVLDISENSVKTRLWRGRRMLQENTTALVDSALSRTRRAASKAFAAGVLAALATRSATAEAATGSLTAPPTPTTATATSLVVRSPLLVGATAAVLLGGVGTWWAVRLTTRAPAPAARSMVAGASVPRWSESLRALSPALRPGQDVDGTLPGPAAAGTLAAPVALLSMDFEDGVLPPGFREGVLERGPPRPGNRFSVAANVLLRWSMWRAGVAWEPPRSPLTYSDTLVISFDYWVGEGRGKTQRSKPDYMQAGVMFGVPGQAWNGKEHVARHFVYTLREAPYETWAHAELRLSDFVPSVPTAPPLREGETIIKLNFVGHRHGDTRLYIDNVKVVDHATAEDPRASAAALPVAH